MAQRITRAQAIRLKCLDCCCGSAFEVKNCTMEKCSLFPFREGKDPYRAKAELTPEQREQRRKALTVAREKQRNLLKLSPNLTGEG